MRRVVPTLVIVVVVILVAARFLGGDRISLDEVEQSPSAVESSTLSSAAHEAEPRVEMPERIPRRVDRGEATVEPEGESGIRPNESVRHPSDNERRGGATPEEIVKGVIESVDSYFAAGFAGDPEAAAKVSTPGSSVIRQAASVRELTSAFPDLPLDVYGGGKHALAVSWLVEVEQPNGLAKGYLVFTLEQSEDGVWLIDDIDFEDEDSGLLEIERFIETHEGELLTPLRE